MHEMRDIGPEGFIAFHEVKHRPKAFGLDAHPKRVDIVRGQLPLAPCRMEFAFKIIKRNLPHDCVDHILNLARQHNLARSLIFSFG